MKQIIIIFLSLLSISAYSQSMESVWGIPFGIHADSVKKLVKLKANQDLIIENGQGILLINEFGTRTEAYFIAFNFNTDGLFCRAYVGFKPENENDIFNLYDNLKDDLILKYGNKFESTEKFFSPYSEAYRQHPSCVEKYLNLMITSWEFNSKFDSKYKAEIGLLLTNNYNISIRYTDKFLAKSLEEKNKTKKISDY